MKKLIPVLIFLLLAGCAQGNQDSLDDLYEAFERNHDSLQAEFSELMGEMEETEDREAKIRIIYEEALPKIEDLRRTIHNYTVTGTEHEQLKEEMLTYTNSLENLVELYGEFNRTFVNYNPLGASDFREEVDERLDEIESQEELVRQRYESIQEDYAQLTSESSS
ncbi:hypothetical protein ACFOU0_06465 [Salinicoccus sesuvii]|uniref:Cell-wall binding lipoprotein n=1 Tax=Salinicoccus sesuvii TaxID=868281 RepID=A0ABV7N3P6_9STAP